MGMSSRTFACRGHEPLNLFFMLAMFRLVFRVRVDILNFLVKRPWGKNVSLLQNLEVIYTILGEDTNRLCLHPSFDACTVYIYS